MDIAGAAGLATGAFGACATPPAPDLEARGMLVLQGASAHLTVAGLRFVDGPRNGFAILRADAPPLSPMDFVRSSLGNDTTRAGVRGVASQPAPEGSCPPNPSVFLRKSPPVPRAPGAPVAFSSPVNTEQNPSAGAKIRRARAAGETEIGRAHV